jgi:hypothetical protein
MDQEANVSPAQPAPVSRDTRPEERLNYMPKVEGKSFRCECGCNVFHKEECDEHAEEFVCNACGQRFEGVPVGASEDTEPARCQQALLGGMCLGSPPDRIHHDRTFHTFHPFKPPAPASDDEKAPGPSVETMRAALIANARNRKYDLEEMVATFEFRVRAEFEAAIRAPLEADLREWRALFDDWRIERKEARDELAAVTAERDRRGEMNEELRVLVEESLGAIIWMSGSADFGPDGQAGEHWAEIRDGLLPRLYAALAAPATEEVQG